MDRPEINEDMTIEQLDAVSGGLENRSTAVWAQVRGGMITGFEAAGGKVWGDGSGSGQLTWSSGGHQIHF
jgi:hypothetical protein